VKSIITRRNVLLQLAAVAGAAAAWKTGTSAQSKTPIRVYKSATCGCCHKWVEHMNASGFAAQVTDTDQVNSVKVASNVKPPLWSCHTALVGGYIIEGHVPAADVRRLLAEKPAGVIGLTIPGMPASAPGMDLTPFQPYDVLAFDAQGRTTIFAKHTR
jgi:hypothetical protein